MTELGADIVQHYLVGPGVLGCGPTAQTILNDPSHHVDKGAEVDERDFRFPAIGNVSSRVKRNGIPDDVGFRLWILVGVQELARSVGAIHLEA